MRTQKKKKKKEFVTQNLKSSCFRRNQDRSFPSQPECRNVWLSFSGHVHTSSTTLNDHAFKGFKNNSLSLIKPVSKTINLLQFKLNFFSKHSFCFFSIFFFFIGFGFKYELVNFVVIQCLTNQTLREAKLLFQKYFELIGAAGKVWKWLETVKPALLHSDWLRDEDFICLKLAKICWKLYKGLGLYVFLASFDHCGYLPSLTFLKGSSRSGDSFVVYRAQNPYRC